MPRMYEFAVEPNAKNPGPARVAATPASAFGVRCKIVGTCTEEKLGLAPGDPWDPGLAVALSKFIQLKLVYRQHCAVIDAIVQRLAGMPEPDPSTVGTDFGPFL